MVSAGGRVPVNETLLVQDFSSLTFRFLVAVDVEGYSERPMSGQASAQDALERAMARAAAAVGLDRGQWYRQPAGDGEFAVLPAGTDGLALVADYPRRLAAALAAVNRSKSSPRLRIRLAIHHGAVGPGKFGPVGAAPVVLSRLVEANSARRYLRQHGDLDLALIVSEPVYREVVASRLRGLRPETFRRIGFRVKGISYVGYLAQDPVGDQAGRPRSQDLPVTLSIAGSVVRDHHEEPAGEPAVTEGTP